MRKRRVIVIYIKVRKLGTLDLRAGSAAVPNSTWALSLLFEKKI